MIGINPATKMQANLFAASNRAGNFRRNYRTAFQSFTSTWKRSEVLRYGYRIESGAPSARDACLVLSREEWTKRIMWAIQIVMDVHPSDFRVFKKMARIATRRSLTFTMSRMDYIILSWQLAYLVGIRGTLDCVFPEGILTLETATAPSLMLPEWEGYVLSELKSLFPGLFPIDIQEVLTGIDCCVGLEESPATPAPPPVFPDLDLLPGIDSHQFPAFLVHARPVQTFRITELVTFEFIGPVVSEHRDLVVNHLHLPNVCYLCDYIRLRIRPDYLMSMKDRKDMYALHAKLSQ